MPVPGTETGLHWHRELEADIISLNPVAVPPIMAPAMAQLSLAVFLLQSFCVSASGEPDAPGTGLSSSILCPELLHIASVPNPWQLGLLTSHGEKGIITSMQ